jgi:hypothetical protein
MFQQITNNLTQPVLPNLWFQPPQGQRVFVAKIFITNQPLWRRLKSPLVATDTCLTNTLVMIFRSPQITMLISDELWYH